jgi:hypothetical protein
MSNAFGKTFESKIEAAAKAKEMKMQQGLNAVVIGPLAGANIVGPSGKVLDWPPDGGKSHYLVIGTSAEIAMPA